LVKRNNLDLDLEPIVDARSIHGLLRQATRRQFARGHIEPRLSVPRSCGRADASQPILHSVDADGALQEIEDGAGL
jgi:hypothetical protein